MKGELPGKRFTRQAMKCIAVWIISSALILPGNVLIFSQTTESAAAQNVASIPPDQLDALVAPIALYPDNLLSQTLVASTYPLEIIQLHQWLQKNQDLTKPGKEKKLEEKVMKQPWDPSIQAMAALPDVVKWLAEDIQWTTDLGNAFLAQQKDVMDAIQRMRAKAQQKGALASNDKQKIETQVVEEKTVIVIEQSDPEVIYVPSYDPIYAYGPIAYPYPPIYYPPYYGGAIAGGLIGFGIGFAIGRWNGGGGWGWNCGWGGGDININRNNNFNRNTNISGGNRFNNVQGGNKWQHNSAHRGGAPYRDRGTADRFGGTARGDSLANRQRDAQRQLGDRGGVSNRADFGGQRGNISNRGDLGNVGGQRGNVSNRGDFGSTGGRGDRSQVSNRGDFGSRGGSDRVGSRDFGSSRGSDRGFGGGRSDGFSGSSSRSSSSRGFSSMGGSRSFGGGGGGGRSFGGGGGRGGGRRR
jgi:hypothetical protein